MTSAFEELRKLLQELPGLGYRSAERIALSLLIEKPNFLRQLIDSLEKASSKIQSCTICGNITEDILCNVCSASNRRKEQICIVESIPDLWAIERSGSYSGHYHVLYGKLSPIKGVNPENLNINTFKNRITQGGIEEVIFALSNDMEGEATCYYLQEVILGGLDISVSRIAFGLPSGGGVVYADPQTLKSAFEGRREFVK